MASDLYTIVGGAAPAKSLKYLQNPGDAGSIAVLSARPDGPHLDLLSLILVMRHDTVLIASKALAAQRTPPAGGGIGMGATVRADGASLNCMWHSVYSVFNASLYRLVCHSNGWSAIGAMRRARLPMQLSISLRDFEAEMPFMAEALSAFPTSGITGCVDFAYHGGDHRRDFNEWATAQEMVGIDRVYVADQLRYRDQVADQVRRGFVSFTHDYPHRYVTAGARSGPSPPTTYAMFYATTSAYNFLCLHEHWYDDWVFVSYSTDEFFITPGETPTPKAREPLITQMIDRFWQSHKVDAEYRTPGWIRRPTHPFCTSELCVNRPFYAPSHLVAGETAKWTLPGTDDQTRLRYGSDTQLSVERFTRRMRILPPKGSVRKCFVHPDWRLGGRMRVHGFKMQSCPPKEIPACKQGWPGLKQLCLQLCGEWGSEQEVLNASCPGFRNDGMLMKDIELAHFRVAPPENQKRGYQETTWLAKLAAPVRHRLAEIEAARAKSGV